MSDDIAAILIGLKELTSAVKQNQQDIANMNHQISANRNEQTSAASSQTSNMIKSNSDDSAENNNNVPFISSPANLTLTRAKIYILPDFSGAADQWPLFIANFNDTTRESNYNNRQNLIRLQKCLSGEAKEAVTAMLITYTHKMCQK
ncbi:hypothetical protein ACLKA7_001043 [Drosophila subpalustris]